MSTKSLDRTIIEGGRYNGNKWDRRSSHAETRAEEKNYLSDITHDPEYWYDWDIEPTRHVYKGFNDKLAPVYRWLHAQVGRSWDDVHSEIAEKFDTRTTAGRHIVNDHLLSSVSVTPEVHRRYYYNPEDPTTSYQKNDFYVDDSGILQAKRYIPRYARGPVGSSKVPQYNTNAIANWLSGRIIGKVGNKLFWFVPADKNKKRGGVSRTWRTIWGWQESRWGGGLYTTGGLAFVFLHDAPVYKLDERNKKVTDEEGRHIIVGYEPTWTRSYPDYFRQGNKLSNKEVEHFNKFPEYYQNKILELSPTNPVPVRPSYNTRYYY